MAFEPRPGKCRQDDRRGNASFDRIPVVAHQIACLFACREQAAHRRNELPEIELGKGSRGSANGPADLQYKHPPTGPQYTPELAERRRKIYNVAQCIAHGDKVHARISDRQVFRTPLYDWDTKRAAGYREHVLAHVETGHAACRAANSRRLSRDEPSTHCYVKDLQALLQPGFEERSSAIPRARTEREYAVDAIVLRCSAIEQRANDRSACRSRGVVARQRRMGLNAIRIRVLTHLSAGVQ